MLNGEVVPVPTSALLAKNSTLLIAPSLSLAEAVSGTFGPLREALLVGLVMLTVGGRVTLMVTGAEGVRRPLESSACTVKEWLPLGGLLQVRLYGALDFVPRRIP